MRLGIANPSYSTHMRYLFVFRVLTMIAGAACYVDVARFLGPSQFGVVTSAAGVVALLQAVLDLGGGTLIARDAAESLPSDNLGIALRYRWLLWRGWFLLSMLALAGAIAGLLDTDLVLVLGVCGLWVLGSVYENLFVGLLTGLGRTSVGASVSLVERLISLGLMLAMPFFMDPDATDFIAAFAVGTLVASGVGRVLTRSECKLALSIAPSLSARSLRRGVSFMAGTMGAQLQNLDVPLMAWLGGAASAGLLAAPSRLTTPLGLVASSVATIILVQRRHSYNELRVLPTAARVAAMTAVGVMPIVVAPDAFALFVMGDGYVGAAGVFRLVALGAVLSSVSQVLAADLIAHHEQRFVASAIIMGGVLGLVVVALTASALGALGGGLGVVSSQILILGLFLAYRRLLLRRKAQQ
jgi:O-antigen/teichoic acid export membrane protein